LPDETGLPEETELPDEPGLPEETELPDEPGLPDETELLLDLSFFTFTTSSA
jgi:hypothetical protein